LGRGLQLLFHYIIGKRDDALAWRRLKYMKPRAVKKTLMISRSWRGGKIGNQGFANLVKSRGNFELPRQKGKDK